MKNPAEEGKKIAIISYITFIGALIAMVMNSDKKIPFASFHIRQALGIILLFFALGYPVGSFDNWSVSYAFYLFFFILWIYGFVGALQGEMRLIPILGRLFQKAFKSL
ncbi:hypothetical protein [Flavobacterium kingsejongi]|uniref:Chloroplast import component protein (Tic20) n=1 Tax=Flavobacterium kingsejongi TaxID=1678728 RepID=A0A2S1LSS8_9FLAO|nr:hypothetical protein [Flavobacterium kingsejongi]AWG26696.1 hypothetical protein FK004_16410 [Flavobacterium kingsejongi]